MLKKELSNFYRCQIENQVLPFWLRNARDLECGGYFSCLDRYGNVYDADKIDILMQGRISWTFAWMYNEFQPVPEWLEFARAGIDFVLKHGISPGGRIYTGLKRDGTPLRPPSNYHAEFSTLIGLVEVARADGDDALYNKARDIFNRSWRAIQDPEGDWMPYLRDSGPIRLHGYSMITINVIQQLRAYREEPTDEQRIGTCIDNMIKYHLRADRRILLENTGWNGEELQGSMGRRINPGHMIEGGIFLIHETWRHKNDDIKDLGLNLIRWGFEAGWDEKYGGIFNDVDADGRPIYGREALLADSKLWWQHAEALYGLLLAYVETGDEWFFDAYTKVHKYSFERFADPEFGEWFAFLDRTGRLINEAKGTDRKCCYHIGRNFLWCAQIAEKL